MTIKSALFSKLLKKLLDHSVPEISVMDAFDLKEEVLFLDAREIEEFRVSHIQNAIHVGYNEFSHDKIIDKSLSQPIIVYCSVGYRSEKIAEQISERGFKKVHNLYGGIFEWYNQGFKVVNTSGETSLVHPFNKAWGIWLEKKEIPPV